MDLVFLSFQEQGDGRHRQQTLMQSQLVKCQKRSGSLSSPFIMHPKNVIISTSLSMASIANVTTQKMSRPWYQWHWRLTLQQWCNITPGTWSKQIGETDGNGYLSELHFHSFDWKMHFNEGTHNACQYSSPEQGYSPKYRLLSWHEIPILLKSHK